jgi:hypothetical protein
VGEGAAVDVGCAVGIAVGVGVGVGAHSCAAMRTASDAFTIDADETFPASDA